MIRRNIFIFSKKSTQFSFGSISKSSLNFQKRQFSLASRKKRDLKLPSLSDVHIPSSDELMRSIVSKVLPLEDLDQMVLISKVVQKKLANDWKEISSDDKEQTPASMQDFFYAFAYAVLLEKRAFQKQKKDKNANPKLDEQTKQTLDDATKYLRYAVAAYGK